MKKLVVGAVIPLQLLGSSVASADTNAPGGGMYTSVTFINNTDSPVWLTLYNSAGRLDTWHIISGSPRCVPPRTNTKIGNLLTEEVRVRTESKKGHGDCNVGTYNDAHYDYLINMATQNLDVTTQLDVDSHGRSSLHPNG